MQDGLGQVLGQRMTQYGLGLIGGTKEDGGRFGTKIRTEDGLGQSM